MPSATNTIRRCRATPGLTLTAVCDTNPERIDAARELAPDLTGFTDAEEMLDSGLLDLVVVSTPPNSHHDWAMKALERDLHVVLEKPMALTADECDAALAFAADKGKTLVGLPEPSLRPRLHHDASLDPRRIDR